ncbi:hypothetical protein C7C45_31930 [Micromonospora arborensis]|uniref:Glycoside hydrolase family 5 domain-containing protein n=1 Tax=Micromonospora arborensis TaxID=2116518 RepID=A0A318NTI9_9ACTN|nr:hypothetical protein [Micromonospora arborensis]PYC63450.1 hypothetical protein C7C45_31930 [Micromonospora arborensis]
MTTTHHDDGGLRLGVVRGITYGVYGEPERFVPQIRDLNGSLVRVYVYWSQIEPAPGQWNFGVVDALLAQLDGTEEVWVTVCSSSPWATRVPTRVLPPSPAKDVRRYEDFVRRLVRHCGGRVHYWQCDNEPTDHAQLWAGTAPEYLTHLRALHAAVRDADPTAKVILGGAPFLLPYTPPDGYERVFFDELLRDGRDHFDLFDLHLYGPAALIPEHVEFARDLMRAHGYEKPVVVGEYNGPWPALFPDAMQVLLGPVQTGAAHGRDGERAAIAELYRRRDELPVSLQMFLMDCPPELDAKRYRMARREIVMRNVLAFSSGIRRTTCWHLAPEAPGFDNRYGLMDVMFRTFALLAHDGEEIARRHPSAEAFALVAGELTGADEVLSRAGSREGHRVFEVSRPGRPPLLVTWLDRDPWSGEDEPDEAVTVDWGPAAAEGVDALGRTWPIAYRDGRVHLALGCTPVFVTAAPGGW